ncbi:MAG: VWA domain-containing protein [Spirochaetaceae bacterium]|jgi:hypothetical protein|nr:VWA domain-containing protein [Spirochaetaceae bacterium]
MNLKKIVFGLLIFCGAFSLFAQRHKDLILIVDTSVDMLPHYYEVGTYLTGPFLADELDFSDTFHLISFGMKPRVEISQPVREPGDIENISSRIWLLYPLETTSSPEAALQFAEQYIRTLPAGRPKTVFLISGKDSGGVVNATAGRFRSSGTDLFFLRVADNRVVDPRGAGTAGETGTGYESGAAGGNRTAGEPAALPRTASASPGNRDTVAVNERGTGTGAAGESAVAGRTGAASSGESSVSGTGSGQNGAEPGDPETAGEGAGLGEEGRGSGNAAGLITPGNTAGTGKNPGTETGDAENAGRNPAEGIGLFINSLSLPFLITAGLLLLLVLAFIIIMIARKLQSSPNKVIAAASSTDDTAARNAELLNKFASQQAEASLKGPHRRYHHLRDDSSQFLTNPPMLTIFVEEQNTAIGRRNVHALKKGNTYTVGGGNSDFLIFLVSIPPRIGRLYFDGNNCTFTPLKPRYFPDIGSNPVHECLGKTIRILSDRNYEIFFHFEQYKDPLIVLNQLLHSISVPSAPDTLDPSV